jgi:hypothetical protein
LLWVVVVASPADGAASGVTSPSVSVVGNANPSRW